MCLFLHQPFLPKASTRLQSSVRAFFVECSLLLYYIFYHFLSSSNDPNWLPCIVIIFCFRCNIHFYLVAHEIEVFVSVVVGLRTD